MIHRYLAILVSLCLVLGFSHGFSALGQTAPHIRAPLLIAQAHEMVVMFNVKSLKFHNPACEWAQRCTRNCVAVPRSEALRRGGVPCKICGGR